MTSPRRRLPPEERRQQLIAAATELYSRRPFEQVSVDDITEAAGVSRALFYRYFASPAELFAAASRTAVDGLIRRLTAPVEGTPEEQVRHGVGEFVRFVEQRPAAFLAVVRNASAISQETGGLVGEVRTAVLDRIKSRVGVTTLPPLVELTVWCWTAVIEEATLRWLADPVVSRDKLVDWLTGQLFAMVAATTGQPFTGPVAPPRT